MIAWYVHHQGRGHLHRATAIARHVREPVTVLSSLPAPPEPHPFAGWVQLPLDLAAPDETGSDHDAGGTLHWAPLGVRGYADRTATISAWLSQTRPRLLVADVSVEVATLARLLGVPVVVVAGPGERTDAPHEFVHRLAERIIAPWPVDVYDPPHLHAHAEKVRHVGAISRFDGRPSRPAATGRRVLLLMGAGGHDVSAQQVTDAAGATPEWTWRVHGVAGAPWCVDVWEALHDADVVVTHAGQNALAEVAAARRPAVVVAQPRPFDEQAATAEALGRAGIAAATTRWPRADEWPALLETAVLAGGAGWKRWSTGHGAVVAARVLDEVGGG